MGKMRFEQFTDAVVQKIRDYLPESFADARIELHTVTKNNDLKLTGLTIRGGGSSVCPTIYLEQYYESYQGGEEMRKVLENIADARVGHEVGDKFDIGQVTDFERVKSRIIPRLVSKQWNEGLLSGRPHKAVADLAVTYHILLQQNGEATATVPVTDAFMEEWGTDTETVNRLAVRNMSVLLPSTFVPMSAVLSGSWADKDMQESVDGAVSDDEMMYVLSNRIKIYGASAVLDEDIMNRILESFGEEFYILPSSVHELIIVKSDPTVEAERLRSLVCEVNAAQVAPDEVLSDHVYRYSAELGLYSV